MKITMAAKSAGFKNGILFFNLRERRYTISKVDIRDGYDICFVLDKHSVYVRLEPDLEFGVLEHNVSQFYGPYNDHISVITLHLFGEYDGLGKLLTESFPFDDEIGSYRFVFGGFSYHRGTYDFTENITAVTRRLSEYVPPMYEPFEYEFEPRTYFAEDTIESFLNRLNVMFNQGNFPEGTKEHSNYITGVVDRLSGNGIRRSNGQAFFAANLSRRRHMVFFIPTRVPISYVSFVSNGSQFAEDILYEYITTAEVETITNASKVMYYRDTYNIESTEATVEVATYRLFDNVVFILAPFDDVRNIFIFVKTDKYGIVPLEFDTFSKRFTVHDKATAMATLQQMDRASLSIDDTTVRFAYDADIEETKTGLDLSLKIKNTTFQVDCKNNRAYTNQGNIFAINYAGNLLSRIFR